MRVTIFTGQTVLAEGFRRVLETSGPFGFCGVTSATDEFMGNLELTRPEIAILDSMAIPGPDFLRQAHTTCQSCNFVLWTEDVNLETVRHAFALGLRGVISARSGPEPLVAALHRIARGELFFPDLYCTPGELATTRLSPREKELIALIAQGLKNKEIATTMNLTEGTVKVYLNRLYHRLGVADRFELALYGLQTFFGNWAESSTTGIRPATGPGEYQRIFLREPVRKH